ncbi:segregation/condensation protein A [Thalassomonas viridans]|uniref:Segregation and condensation protein A n=1 Tax=Thalassomonas viridans TaxID=137584 RepID=A0AAE9Z7K8_9GAMM|nr:ScpA family protein [Thalassomonas viridans]WDE08230.1 segregation/condensation protein A [Thalassomonas viridans]
MVQQVLPLAFIRGEALIEKPQDLFIPPDALEVILETFEGPLDLLLYLIRKQKFDIMDLPISPITEQYMVYVELMKDLKLELAAEYLVMAAILAEIKSRLLLPKQTVDEEEEDPRAELVRRLQEYEVIKHAAEDLDSLPRLERDIFTADVALADNFKQRQLLAEVSLAELMAALNGVIKRNSAFEHHHIHKESLSTRERMSAILAQLKQTPEQAPYMEFSRLFTPEEGRQGVVVTFLAILELIKESLIECIQSQVYGMLQVRLKG